MAVWGPLCRTADAIVACSDAIAAELASMDDGMVRSLTLIAPLLPGVSLDHGFLRDLVSARRSRELKEVLSRLVVDEANIGRAMVEDVLKYKRLDGVAAALERLAEVAQQVAAEPGSSPIPPAMAIWGAMDRIIPMPTAETLPSGVQLETIQSAGHMPHLEEPAKVSKLIVTHLARHYAAF